MCRIAEGRREDSRSTPAMTGQYQRSSDLSSEDKTDDHFLVQHYRTDFRESSQHENFEVRRNCQGIWMFLCLTRSLLGLHRAIRLLSPVESVLHSVEFGVLHDVRASRQDRCASLRAAI